LTDSSSEQAYPCPCIDGGALTIEGEDVVEDVVLDVVEAAASRGVIGVEEGAAAERRLELGVAADELRPHPLHLLLGLGAALRPRPEEAHQSMRGARGRRADLLLLLLAAVHHRHRLKRRHDDGGYINYSLQISACCQQCQILWKCSCS